MGRGNVRSEDMDLSRILLPHKKMVIWKLKETIIHVKMKLNTEHGPNKWIQSLEGRPEGEAHYLRTSTREVLVNPWTSWELHMEMYTMRKKIEV